MEPAALVFPYPESRSWCPLGTLYEDDLDIADGVDVVLDSEGLGLLAAVLPVRADHVAVAEIEITRNGVVVQRVVLAPFLVQYRKLASEMARWWVGSCQARMLE